MLRKDVSLMAQIFMQLQSTFFLIMMVLSMLLGAGVIYLLSRLNRVGTSKKDTIVVGMYAEYKPFEFVNKDGEISGFDVDYFREIAKQLHLKLVIKNIGFDALIPALKHGEVDAIISGMAITPERLREMEMVPYHGKPLRSFALLFWKEIPNGVRTIHDLAKLPNRQVAVQVGTIQEDFLFRFDFIKAKPVCSTSGLVLDIRHGDSIASFVLSDLAYTLQTEYPKMRILEVPLAEKDWILGDGIGIRKGNKVLAKNLEQTVLKLRENGFATKAHQKWFGKKDCDL